MHSAAAMATLAETGMELSQCSFGARITTLRAQSGYTLQQLAQLIGVSKVALWKWENESTIPREDRLRALSAALGVSVDFLVSGTSKGASSRNSQAQILHELIVGAKQSIADAAGINPERITISLDY